MSKNIELKAFTVLEKYVKEHIPNGKLTPTMNKGSGQSNGVADAVLEFNNIKTHIEIKSRSKKSIGTNIRFTHQTIRKSQGYDLIVALITNLDVVGEEVVNFFRLGAVQNQLIVEPHFIVQQKSIKNRTGNLVDLLSEEAIKFELPKFLEDTLPKP